MGYVHTGCGLRNLTVPPDLGGAFQACQQLASLCDNEAGTRTDPARAWCVHFTNMQGMHVHMMLVDCTHIDHYT